MKSLLKALSAVALSSLALPALAGDDGKDQKDLKKVIEDQGINYVETAQKGITLSGYVDTSYNYQFGHGGNPYHAFDTDKDDFNINAVKIALEKALPDKNEWAAGFRIDTMYGEDAGILSGDPAGDHASSLFLEQALVKFRIPVGNGLDVYFGKFVTFLGYEVIESPANLNFSRSLLFQNAIPLTHTGGYADYKFNDTFEAKLGIVDGWNSSDTVYLDGGNFGKAVTGQFTINAPGKNANVTASFIYSPDGDGNAISADNGPYVVGDIWGNWSPLFVKDSALLLGFNADFGYNGAAAYPANTVGLPQEPDTNTWFGVALYAQYKFNKVFSLAARGEYLHEDGAAVQKFVTPTGGSVDDWEGTLTASFNLWDNLLTRIEYRHDILQGYSDQDEISFNAVYSF